MVRGLKYLIRLIGMFRVMSHHASGAWIEIKQGAHPQAHRRRRITQVVRGLKLMGVAPGQLSDESHHASGAWIEINATLLTM